MMDNEKPARENTDISGEYHCEDMDSGMGSMMGSCNGLGIKSMM